MSEFNDAPYIDGVYHPDNFYEEEEDFEQTLKIDGIPEYRIGQIEGGFMISCAFFADFVQVIMEFGIVGFIINPIVTIFAALTFFVWFKIKGISLFASKQFAKRALPFFISFFIDIIPGTDMSIILAFTWTISISIIVVTVRLDDKFQTEFFEGLLSRAVNVFNKN